MGSPFAAPLAFHDGLLLRFHEPVLLHALQLRTPPFHLFALLVLSPHGHGRRDDVSEARGCDLLHCVAGNDVLPFVWERVHEQGALQSQ